MRLANVLGARSEKDVVSLVHQADRRKVREELGEGARSPAGLFERLSLRRRDRILIRLDAACRDLPTGRIGYEAVPVDEQHPAAGNRHDAGGRVLLIHRHRFITDTTGWEIPAGRVEKGEEPIEAARRETLEETGWRPGPLSMLFSYFPSIGLMHPRFNVFLADG